MHIKFLESKPPVSWHYTVDDNGVYQHLPENIIGYHAGDGLRPFKLIDTKIKAKSKNPKVTISDDGYYMIDEEKTNIKAPLINDRIPKTEDITPSGVITFIGDNSNYYISETYLNKGYQKISNQGGGTNGIGIESCVDEGSDLYATWQNLAKLVAHLLIKHNLGLERVMQHNHFSGKNCPQTLRTSNLWDYFMEMVSLEYALQKNFSNYKFLLKTKSNLINKNGKLINMPTEKTNIEYTVTIINDKNEKCEVNLVSFVE